MKTTRTIYIVGDVGDHVNCKLYDARTHEFIDTVTQMQVTVTAGAITVADVRLQNGSNARWEVVPRRSAFAGHVVHLLALTESVDMLQSGTRYQAHDKRFVITSDGRLERGDGDRRAVQVVADVDLINAVDPDSAKRLHAERAVDEIIRGIRGDLLGYDARTRLVDAPAPIGKCTECKGTGWYEGFNKRERCSRGCPTT